jgi:hypothetical protein
MSYDSEQQLEETGVLDHLFGALTDFRTHVS